MPHELWPTLQTDMNALRSRIARANTAMSQVAGDSSALNAVRRRLNALGGELAKLEHTKRMFIEQAHGG